MTIERLVFGDLTIEPNVPSAGGPFELVCRGKSNDRQPSRVLLPYVTDCLTVAHERGATVRLHLAGVEHLNSSTITALIQMIQEARTRNVPLALVYDPAKKWQKLSFDALRVFVKDDGLFALEEALS